MTINALNLLQKKEWLLGTILVTSVTFAASADERDDAYQCALIAEQQARHACIDAVAGRLETSGQPASLAGAPESVPAAELGAEQLKSTSEKQARANAETVMIDLEKITYGQRRLASFHLANGQVWRQTELVRFSDGNAARSVEIRKGTIGGYRLRLDNQRQFMRVRRIQ